MAEKPIRSKTGCLTCKTRRKKCDEERPTCNRCARAKMDCLGYSYLDNPEELIQARARIASRASAVRSSSTSPGYDVQYQSAMTTFSLDPSSSEGVGQGSHLTRSYSVPSGLPSSSSSGYDPAQGTTSPGADNVHLSLPKFSSLSQHAGPSSMDTRSTRESGWWRDGRNVDTLHGGVSHEGFMSQPQANTNQATGSIDQFRTPGDFAHQHQHQLHEEPSLRAVSYSRLSSPDFSDGALYECDSESTDRSEEEIAETLCGVSVNPDMGNDMLQYVLQSYAIWIMETVFEPAHSVYQVRNYIVEKFMASDESRSALVSIAGIVRAIGKTSSLNTNQASDIKVLHQQAQRAVAIFNVNEQHMYEQDSRMAADTLNLALQTVSVHLAVSPFGMTVSLLREIAVVFKRIVAEPIVNLPSKLCSPNADLRLFTTLDVLSSLASGCPMCFSYDTSYVSNMLFNITFGPTDALGLQWMYGCPETFIVLLARMHYIRSAPTYATEARELDGIENAIRNWRYTSSLVEEPAFAVARMVIQECWRQSLLIYLFMGIGGVDSSDARVIQAHKVFMKVIKSVQPSRTPDLFLLLPLLVAAVASYKRRDRNKIFERTRSIRECVQDGTAGHDIVAMMLDVWEQADGGSRATLWSDVEVAFHKVTGI